MNTQKNEAQLIEEAWQCFAAGNLEGAIALAQLAGDAQFRSALASASLSYFLIQANQLDEASAVLLPARQRFPKHAQVAWYGGYLLKLRGDTLGAADELERACQLDPNLDEAAYLLAWMLHDLGRLDEAMGWAQHALRFSRLPQRLMQVGWLLQKTDRLAQAVQTYSEAIDTFSPTASELPRLHLHLVQCLFSLGRTAQAEKVLGEALDKWPQDAHLLQEGATRCRVLGDFPGALKLASRWVQLCPGEASAWHLLGVMQQCTGGLKAADQSFLECQKLDNSLTDALVRRACIQRGWRQFEGAHWLLDLALRQKPEDREAQGLMAQVLLDLGRDDEARRMLVTSVKAQPRNADMRRLLAVVQARRGRHHIALRSLQHVFALDPDNVEAMRLQAWLALEQGHLGLAEQTSRHLLARLPSDSAAQVQGAFILVRTGHLPEAQGLAERAIAYAPGFGEGWRALSHVRLGQGNFDSARSAILQALHLAPDNPDNLRQLSTLLAATGRLGEARLALLRLIDGHPDHVAAQLELAELDSRSGHFVQALSVLNALLRKRASWLPALELKARVLTEGGMDGGADLCAQLLRQDRNAPAPLNATLRLVGLGNPLARGLLAAVPLETLRRAWPQVIERVVHKAGQVSLLTLCATAKKNLDEDPWLACAALYAASLCASSDGAALALQAREWYRSLKIRAGLTQLPVLPTSNRPRSADYRPRIAYVASQLHHSLLRRVLAAHKSDNAHIFFYTNQAWPELPAHVCQLPLLPETLAESCAANQIDVLIDTGGLHPFEGQFGLLQAYARRVAPVQVAWLGCWGTAGGLFDVLLADEAAVPIDQQGQYEEAVRYLVGGQWCWDPPLAAPIVAPPPCLTSGSVTFGVTARSLRLGDRCLDAFASVVAATPQSTIRFIGSVAGDWPLRRHVLACMQGCGVDPDRVFFDPFLPYSALFEWFSGIDLVLDSFPANGGLSLLDPLWMGIPVVTLAGGWAGARQGTSILTSLGHPQWVAHSVDDFCDKAVGLASDGQALALYRSNLRASMIASPLLDGRRVASQIESICAQLRAAGAPIATALDVKSRVKAHAQVSLDDWLAVPRSIRLSDSHAPAFAIAAQPELSVVVVLFNQAGLSRRTLQALADQRGVSFETIVVDNASCDRTSKLLACLHGARVVRNQTNVGFILAARQGAALAKGRYIAFLNSDAILQPGALKATLAAMQADPEIGALGGRVVLTDGDLQEAGNVIFSDGSVGGIGRKEDAFGSAARTARPTDYVSGVFLVTPTSLWKLLGGFDEAYAPAYYEDTDYCVRVWQAGFRVVYEPSVLLEHLESGSASGDSANALMAHNRVVFYERHRDWLERQSLPQTLSLDGDRWRSPEDVERLPRVLVIDNEVPHTFKGGGLPRAQLMLQALAGWPVTAYPLWGLHDDWPAVYQSLPGSVEVVLGQGLSGLEAFLERRSGVYDVLLVSRPPNLHALQALRSRRPDLFKSMRLVYDAEALFALRDIAMAGVKKRPRSREAARALVVQEVALANGAQDVLVVSQRDAQYFEAAGHRTTILGHGVGLRRSAPGVRARAGLLFVGALHSGTPNEDGLMWFMREVMPLLRQRFAVAPILSVVGVCTSQEVAALAGSDIKILWTQQDLLPHYDAARVFIAPVRFAGGVPAKVIEAAANGIPVVASALLVRQLQWSEGIDVQSARDAPAFAAAIARLLTDDSLWQRQQHSAFDQCARRYDPDLFGHTLRRVLMASQTGKGS